MSREPARRLSGCRRFAFRSVHQRGRNTDERGDRPTNDTTTAKGGKTCATYIHGYMSTHWVLRSIERGAHGISSVDLYRDRGVAARSRSSSARRARLRVIVASITTSRQAPASVRRTRRLARRSPRTRQWRDGQARYRLSARASGVAGWKGYQAHRTSTSSACAVSEKTEARASGSALR